MKPMALWLFLFLPGAVLPALADQVPVPAANNSPWVSMSDSDNTDPPQKGTWFMQLNGDLGSAMGNLAPSVNPGWGGEASIGYHLPRDFEMALEIGFDSYSGKNASNNGEWNIAPLVAKVIYVVGNGFFQPYVFLGAGMIFNTKIAFSSAPANSLMETDFLGEAGLGLSFDVDEGSCLFIQTKVAWDNTSANYNPPCLSRLI